jgi:hypothetical protein
MSRPVGVTILAILNFIGAAFCLLGGIGMILGGGFIATMLSQQGQGSAGAAGVLAGLGAAAGIFIIIMGGVSALLGFGMWKLKGGRASSALFSLQSVASCSCSRCLELWPTSTCLLLSGPYSGSP